MKRLDLVVGPNGAGKSTFVEQTLVPLLPQSVYINADVIAQQRWPGQAEQKSYEAARIAAATRDRLIDDGKPFIAETVFSHESKLDLLDRAHQAGFVVFLHVVLVPESLAVLRVAHRAAGGGHTVPEPKIRARYQRLWPLVAVAVLRADVTTVYNTAAGTPAIVAKFVSGVPVGDTRWPDWTPRALVRLA